MNQIGNRYRNVGFLMLILAIAGVGIFTSAPVRALSLSQIFSPTVLGDDDENDDEGGDENDEGDDDEYDGNGSSGTSGSSKTVTTYVTRYETRQVSKVVTVTPPEYRTDTDGDGLVDAIDPDPNRHQRDYFTDTDGDSVSDAFDRHPGEDDFAYVEGDADVNGNGIIDTYEGM